MFAIVSGLSSAIVGLLGVSDIPIIHLYGNSSTGKTTFLKLAVSCWGDSEQEPLKSNWNATSNALYAMLNNNYGVAVGLDEASCTRLNVLDTIYAIARGRDKARCNVNAELKESKTWRTTVISTAECSLLSMAKENSGIKARCMEYFDLEVTENAKHAEDIGRFISTNFGELGVIFVNLLISKSYSQIYADYEELKSEISDRITDRCGVSERVFKQYAIMLITAKYAKELGIEIDEEQIFSLLEQHHQSLIEETNMAERLYEVLLNYVSRCAGKFTDGFINPDDRYRLVEGIYEKDRFYISVDVFDRVIAENGYTDSKVARKELATSGYLIKNKDRYYVKKTINGVPIKAYHFAIAQPDEETAREDKEAIDRATISNIKRNVDFEVELARKKIISNNTIKYGRENLCQ